MNVKILLLASLCVIGHYKLNSQGNAYKFSSQIEQALLKDSIQYNQYRAAWDYSFIGAYGSALTAFDKAEPAAPGALTDEHRAAFAAFRARPAVEYLTERARKERIVILNEAHHQPMHRVFAASLLEGLYKAGYRYLGVEALASDTLLNKHRVPLLQYGFYTQEPQFGNLLREALQTGFTVFGYEAPYKKAIEREIGQATNIKAILEKDPAAKILIFCGFTHVVEEGHPLWSKAMAGRVHELTGINPLTIDQVDYTEHSSPKHEAPLYQLMRAEFPAVFLNGGGEPFNARGQDSAWVDVKIMHPRTRFKANRPEWLLRGGRWKLYDLAHQTIPVRFPCLVAAYPTGEDVNKSVPVDQIELLDSKTPRVLVLPPGKFEIVWRDVQGQSHGLSIKVPK